MLLEFLADTTAIYNIRYLKGERITYHPWNYDWQGMTEPERVKKGIFIHCCGHGEFDRFDEGKDVKRIEDAR